MERRTYWRRAIRPAVLGNLTALLLLIALIWVLGWMERSGVGHPKALSELLCSTAYLFAGMGILCTLVGLVWSILSGLCHWQRWKRAAERGERPRLSQTWARVRGGVDELGRLLMGLYFLCALLELALPLLGYSGYDVAARRPELREDPLVMAEEVGVDPAEVVYLAEEPVFSLLVRGQLYWENARAEGGYQSVCCERYTCMSEGLPPFWPGPSAGRTAGTTTPATAFWSSFRRSWGPTRRGAPGMGPFFSCGRGGQWPWWGVMSWTAASGT